MWRFTIYRRKTFTAPLILYDKFNMLDITYETFLRNEGGIAFTEGRSMIDCPYIIGSDEGDCWIAGYLQAKSKSKSYILVRSEHWKDKPIQGGNPRYMLLNAIRGSFAVSLLDEFGLKLDPHLSFINEGPKILAKIDCPHFTMTLKYPHVLIS